MIPSSSLNIACSCRACATFLRPTTPSSEQPYLPPSLVSLSTPPATPNSTKKKKKNTPLLPTPSWVDKLSLSAYEAATLTPETYKPLHASLNINTSGLQKASSVMAAGEESQSTRNAFPKTPGTLRCSHVECRTRIPVTSGLNVKAPLCEEHGDDSDVFYDTEEVIGDAASEKIPKVQSSDLLIFRAEGGVRGRGRASRKIAPESARRTSSAASWSSVASLDDSKLSRSGNVSFEWAARAFDSRLCW